MGAVSRLLNRYNLGVQHLQRAEEFYTKSKQIVRHVASTQDRPRHREHALLLSQGSGELMCLDAMILETLQSRATFHFQHQHDVQKAIECHEEVIERLIQLEQSQHWENVPLYSVYIGGVMFTPLSKEQHCDLLIELLENLVRLYRESKRSKNG
jgi:hypothetical protein